MEKVFDLEDIEDQDALSKLIDSFDNIQLLKEILKQLILLRRDFSYANIGNIQKANEYIKFLEDDRKENPNKKEEDEFTYEDFLEICREAKMQWRLDEAKKHNQARVDNMTLYRKLDEEIKAFNKKTLQNAMSDFERILIKEKENWISLPKSTLKKYLQSIECNYIIKANVLIPDIEAGIRSIDDAKETTIKLPFATRDLIAYKIRSKNV